MMKVIGTFAAMNTPKNHIEERVSGCNKRKKIWSKIMENITTGNTGIITYYESMYSHVPVYCSTKDNATLAPKYTHQ